MPARLGVTNRGCPAFRRWGSSARSGTSQPVPRCRGSSSQSCVRAIAPSDGGPVTSGHFPRHAKRPGAAGWAGRVAGLTPVCARPNGDHDASQPAVRFDPLIHPVAITGHCVIGDQIGVPAARCAMAGCGAAFADPAALGEADNRARAVAGGWATDFLGRLMCPACQRAHPVPAWWVLSPEPGTAGDRGPADGPAPPAGDMNQSVRSAAAGRPPAAAQGGHHQTQWPRLLSVLVGSRDGWPARAWSRLPDAGAMPGQAQPSTPHRGQAVHAGGSAGRRARARRTAATTDG